MNAVYLTALILAALRVLIGFTVEPETPSLIDVYKTTAHLFMGGLAVVWWNNKKKWWWLFWGMCALEVVVAVWSRN